MTIAEIAKEFGVHRNTVAYWIDPGKLAKLKADAKAWRKANPYQTRSEAYKERQNAYQRQRYATNPKVRERLNELATKYRGQAQFRIAHAIRLATLGFADRHSPTYKSLMESATGMTRQQFTAQFNWPGTFDHKVPLVAFDLTDPVQLLKAIHPSNVRLVAAKENQSKGDSGRNVDLATLPFIDSPEARSEAAAFIGRQLSRLRP